MNSLSWLLYLADVAGNFQNAMIGTCVASFMSLMGITMVMDSYNEEEKRNKLLKKAVCVFFIAGAMGTFMPSSKTVYAIAASEYGEDVLKMPEASKARQALNAWLDKQIGEQKPEKAK